MSNTRKRTSKASPSQPAPERLATLCVAHGDTVRLTPDAPGLFDCGHGCTFTESELRDAIRSGDMGCGVLVLLPGARMEIAEPFDSVWQVR